MFMFITVVVDLLVAGTAHPPCGPGDLSPFGVADMVGNVRSPALISLPLGVSWGKTVLGVYWAAAGFDWP